MIMGPSRIALLYLLAGSLWIVSSDRVLAALAPEGFLVGQTIKGLLFVVAGAAVLFLVGRRVQRDRQELEREHARLERRLAAVARLEAMGQLTGGIAHDFNNLLTAINGHARFALEEIGDFDAAREDLTAILTQAERAHNLTRQLLAFSRQQVIEPRVLDLAQVLRGAETMLHRLIGEDIELVISLAPDPALILADPTQVEQVLLKLAVNAKDAMPEGGRLTIDAAVVDATGALPAGMAGRDPAAGYVRLRVSDTGTGMDRETQEQVFEPFFTTKPSGTGTGLGLSTVYGIIKQAGGHVFVESEPGAGTTFEIFLPQADGEVDARVEPRVHPDIVTGTECVLVVEDDADVRALVRRSLERAGYRVLVADGGDQALAIYERDKDRIALLLTDVVMPHIGGRDLARRLRALSPGLRVLFMSGYAEHELARRGILEPGADLLEKPFEPEALQRRVRAVLDRPPGP
jgi:two-component system, cell cycle sensor histidine kinase and response regulator CckA